MREVTLGLGLCDCIKDWDGKFDGQKLEVNGTTFRLVEEIVRDGRSHRNHIWIDRHYYESWGETPGQYETVIDFRIGWAWKPDEKHHSEAIFATSYSYMMTSRWCWTRKPSVKKIIEKIKHILALAIKKCDFEEWLQSFAKIAHLPLLE